MGLSKTMAVRMLSKSSSVLVIIINPFVSVYGEEPGGIRALEVLRKIPLALCSFIARTAHRNN